MLAARGVDFVGLWYGVAGGPHDLPLDRWGELADAAAATGQLAAVLVTFAKDADALRKALERSPAHWIQLHGYQTPGWFASSRRGRRDVRVIKVLHIRGGECLEGSLIGAYEKAGVDVFLFDVVTDDGRVGSTGQTLDPGVVAPLADKLNRPFLLAGGISAANRDRYERSSRIRGSWASTSTPTPAAPTAGSALTAWRRSAHGGSGREGPDG